MLSIIEIIFIVKSLINSDFLPKNSLINNGYKYFNQLKKSKNHKFSIFFFKIKTSLGRVKKDLTNCKWNFFSLTVDRMAKMTQTLCFLFYIRLEPTVYIIILFHFLPSYNYFMNLKNNLF